MVGAENVLKDYRKSSFSRFLLHLKLNGCKKTNLRIFKKVSKILLPKDYIRYRLTGEFFSDVSDASGTSLLNVGERKWSEEILQVLGWDPSWLPPVTESTEMSAKNLLVWCGWATGLLEGTPVAAGGGDCAAQAVGSAIVEEGKVSVTLGTSGGAFLLKAMSIGLNQKANFMPFAMRYQGNGI